MSLDVIFYIAVGWWLIGTINNIIVLLLEFNGVQSTSMDYAVAVFASMDSLFNPFFYALTNAPVRDSIFGLSKKRGATDSLRASSRIAPSLVDAV